MDDAQDAPLNDLEALKTLDPELYEYLKENDKGIFEERAALDKKEQGNLQSYWTTTMLWNLQSY